MYAIRSYYDSHAELDYLWEHKKQIFPIEVKSGKIGTLKSLYVYAFEMQKSLGVRFDINQPVIENIETQIRIKAKNQDVKFKLLSLPMYLTYKLDDVLDEFTDK